MNDCYLIQGDLQTSISMPAGQITTVCSNTDITTMFSYLAVGTIPTGRTLIGAVFLWGNGSSYVAPDCLVMNGLLTLKLWNFGAQSTLTNIRLLTFWE